MKEATDSWADQYKHPKWQKKRLEVLERDEYTCQRCGDKESTLHVHHTFYEKGSKMWECNKSSLITLCNDCHRRAHALIDTVKRYGISTSQLNWRDGRGFVDNPLITLEDISDMCLMIEICNEESIAYKTFKLAVEMFEAERLLNEANATIEEMEQ